jgi:histidinol dehydrogenase
MTFTARPLRLSTADSGFDAALQQRLHWSADTDAGIEQAVADILRDVQRRGDAAVLEYTSRFDGVQASSLAELELKPAELKLAFDSLVSAQRHALEAAAERVRSYHVAQRKASGESWSYREADGTLLGQKVTPLDRVGIYVPGGKAAYPSSVLMNAIPAQVAGVSEIIMVVPTPARRDGSSTDSRGERWPTARKPCRAWTRSPVPATPTWPRPSGACSARSAST